MPDAPSLKPGAALAVLAPAWPCPWPWPLPAGAVLVPAGAAAGRGLSPGRAWRQALEAALAARPGLLAVEIPPLAPLLQQAVVARLCQARSKGLALLLLTPDLNLAATLAEQAWVAPGPAQPLPRLLRRPPHAAARALVAAARLPAAGPPAPAQGRMALALHQVPGLPLWLGAGETLAILGDEPEGRRRLALTLAGLAPPPGGLLALDGHAIPWPAARRTAAERAGLQLLLPDHATPLDPRRSLRWALQHRLSSLGQPTTRAAELLTACGLDPALSWQTPPQLSAEQRQRAALALALAANPGVLLSLDWTAGLPAAAATELLALLARLRGRAAWLMLGEPLPLAARHASHLAVLHQGRIVESGPTSALLSHQAHPATAALVAQAAATRRMAAAAVVPITAAAID